MSKPEVSVIIVNYNTVEEIEKCLKSVISQQTTADSLEVIVVDNASSDDSAQVIKKFSRVKLIQNSKNLGFAKANNIGARQASGDFLFFLNPDCEIKKDTIGILLEFAKKHPNAILGPKLLNHNGSTQGSCYNLPTVFGAAREYWFGVKSAYEKFAPKVNGPIRVQAIVGAAMFCSKEVFQKLGGFDEHYFLYYEDLDFCRRAAKFKIPIYYLPTAIVVHSLGKAGGDITQLTKSARIYHGLLRYYLLTLIIKLGTL